MANGGACNGKYVTTPTLPQLSNKLGEEDTFEESPTSLMSVGKTADDGNVSIFTKYGVPVYKEEDVLITCQRKPILIGKRDEHGRYRYRYLNITGNGNHTDPQRKHIRHIAYMNCHPKKKLSNGCTQYADIQSSPCG